MGGACNLCDWRERSLGSRILFCHKLSCMCMFPITLLSSSAIKISEFILKDMERLLEGKSFLVLTGKTGVGKTRLLRRLKDEGYPVIDLEAIAQHRGSVFGRVGIRKEEKGVLSQKECLSPFLGYIKKGKR